MKIKRYADEQIISVLTQHESAASVLELSLPHALTKGTIYRCTSEFGGMAVSEAEHLRDLEQENARLKRLLAEAALDKSALRELVEADW